MKGILKAFAGSVREEASAMFRIRPVIFMLLMIPLVYPMVVSWLYSAGSAVERPAVIIDQDNSALSRTLTVWIDATRDVKVVGRLDSVEEGWQMIRRNKAEVLIFIPPDFSTRVKQGKQADYKVWVNSANIFTMGMALPGVYGASGTLGAAIGAKYLMAAKGVPPSVVAARVQPIETDMRPEFLPAGSYGDFLTCGILMMVIHQLMLLCTGYSIGFQKTEGRFRWSDPWPYTRALGRLVAQSPFYVGAAAFIVYTVIPLFGWPVTSLNTMMLLYGALMVTMVPFTLLITALLRDHIGAFELLMFLSAPVFLMSGFSWPADQMPEYLRTISAIMPITPALRAQRVVMLKSSSLADLAPYLHWMAIHFAAYTAVGIAVVNRHRIFRLPGRFRTAKEVLP